MIGFPAILYRYSRKTVIGFPAILYRYLIQFLSFSHALSRKPFTLSRKPLYYHENSQQVSVIIQAVSVFV